VDAIINWDVTRYLSPDKVEAVFLEPKQVARISYTSIAQATTSKEPEAAKQFIAFLASDEGRAVYRKLHYLATEEEARKLATPETPVGGEWPLPKGW
jgi:ABC-type Fe3+ transport system substrate-binding protein